MKKYEQIQYDVADGILTITMNRPEKLNAFTGTMMTEMIDAFDRSDADDSIRAVIVTGAGRAFCAGADLASGGNTFNSDARGDERPRGSDARGDERPRGSDGRADRQSGLNRDGGGLLTLRIYDSLKPVIAAVNGAAVGIGATMTLAMDVRLASEAARFGFVFARRGIVPEACSSWFLPRAVGISKALEWTYSGRVFPVEEAKEARLVSRVLPREELLPAARELAREIADNTSAVSVTLIRQMMWRMLGADHPMEAHKLDSRGVYYTGRSPDAREGVESFLEKRAAKFPGKVSTDMPEFFPWWKARSFE